MLVLLIACIIIFIASLSFVLSGKGNSFDTQFSEAVVSKRQPVVTKIMHFFTELGKGKPTTIIIAVLFFLTKSGTPLPKIAAFSTVSTIFIGRWLKKAVKRIRPTNNRLVEEKDFSFPSAHALASAALYGSISLNTNVFPPTLGLSVILLCVFLIFCIGFSRIYLGIHFLSDVIGGWSLGLALASAVTIFFTSGIS